MRALTPRYDSSNHGVYVREITGALHPRNAATIHNIALTGAYGTGKSSVLQEIQRLHRRRLLQISLSTLGTARVRPAAEAGPAPDASQTLSGQQAESPTNQIQKEIVKQLLYQQRPHRLPGSRCRRLAGLPVPRTALVAVLLGLALAVVVLVTDTAPRLAAVFPPPTPPLLQLLLICWAVAAVAAFVLLALTHNRLTIEKLSAGSATIQLTAARTYFDEYLDEIVYFFQVSRRTIVVFEDIDRFNDPYIFETLRSLNTLLNSAQQLRRRPIRFIYAIKDSIFDELERYEASADADDGSRTDHVRGHLARANRTKFFDLVIPVVPFITHLNARDLMTRTMADLDPPLDAAVIDVAGRHITDMRLILEARNEYLVFAQVILDSDSGLQLRREALFAMMLYKSTHLSDFEAIRTQQSRLDELYRVRTDLIAENLAEANREALSLRRDARLEAGLQQRSHELGQRVIAYARRFAEHTGTGYDFTNASVTVSFAGRNYPTEEIPDIDLWRSYGAAPAAMTVTISIGYPTMTFTLTTTDLSTWIGDPLPGPLWNAREAQRIQRRLTELDTFRSTLRRATLQELHARADITVTYQGQRRTFAQVTEQLIESELARNLIAAGYIDSDFTLYTSKYYGDRVSAAASNFILHVLDPGAVDPHAQLTQDDLAAILRERGEDVLDEPGILNISIFDHLLSTTSPHLEAVMARFDDPDDDEDAFARTYLADGEHRTAFARRLAGRWPQTLHVIASGLTADETTTAALLNAALLGLQPDIEYITSAEVRDLVQQHYRQMPVFTTAQPDLRPATVTAPLVAAGVAFEDLTVLHKTMREEAARQGLYRPTRSNLHASAAGSADEPDGLALDRLHERAAHVSEFALAHATDYLQALHNDEVTIAGGGRLIETLQAAGRRAPDQLPELVARMRDGLRVTRLEDLPADTWPVLVAAHRIQVTAGNLTAYLDRSGADEALTGLLRTSDTIEAGEADQQQQLAVARSVLAIRALPAPKRVRLAASLQLDDPLSPGDILVEDGDFIAALVRHRLLPDDGDAFALTADLSWPTREALLTASATAADYLTADLLRTTELPALLHSDTIPIVTKDRAVTLLSSRLTIQDRDALVAVADYCADDRWVLPPPMLTRMASAGVPANRIIGLLRRHPASLDEAELEPVLESLGDPYRRLLEVRGRRPSLPDTPADRALIERLVALGLARGFSQDGTRLRVQRRQNGA